MLNKNTLLKDTEKTDPSAMKMLKIHSALNAGLLIVLLSIGGINFAEAQHKSSLIENLKILSTR